MHGSIDGGVQGWNHGAEISMNEAIHSTELNANRVVLDSSVSAGYGPPVKLEAEVCVAIHVLTFARPTCAHPLCRFWQAVDVAIHWQPAAGALAELALPEEGMAGSWYAVEVLEVSDSNEALVLICELRDDKLSVAGAAQADELSGGLAHDEQSQLITLTENRREWHPNSRLRPRPPQAHSSFEESLQPGGLAELWYEGGWWQVIVRRTPHATLEEDDCSEADLDVRARHSVEADAFAQQPWELESLHFANCHCEQQPLLRPCWRWQPSKRVDRCWSICDKVTVRTARTVCITLAALVHTAPHMCSRGSKACLCGETVGTHSTVPGIHRSRLPPALSQVQCLESSSQSLSSPYAAATDALCPEATPEAHSRRAHTWPS